VLRLSALDADSAVMVKDDKGPATRGVDGVIGLTLGLKPLDLGFKLADPLHEIEQAFRRTAFPHAIRFRRFSRSRTWKTHAWREPAPVLVAAGFDQLAGSRDLPSFRRFGRGFNNRGIAVSPS
jgi:hypothetical protein